jgi:hypothetical protein
VGAAERYQRAFNANGSQAASVNGDQRMCAQLVRALDTLLPEHAPFDAHFAYRFGINDHTNITQVMQRMHRYARTRAMCIRYVRLQITAIKNDYHTLLCALPVLHTHDMREWCCK